jgi:DNA-binding transcriptional regulator YiaG
MIRKDLVFLGLGFPVIIRHCPVTMIRGAESPDIDLNQLISEVFNQLVLKPDRFSGNQLRFIRSVFESSQVEFARMLNQKGHPIVSNWESKKQKFTGMDLNTEIILRQKMALKSKSISIESLLNDIVYKNAVDSDPVEVDLDVA